MGLTQQRVRELFDYKDGQLFWRQPKQGRKLNRPVGCNSGGYLITMIEGRLYKVHRIIFLYHHGHMPIEVDHEDTDGLNNRIENLRDADSAKNKYNRGRNRNNTSGYKGVTWDKRRGKWIGQIMVGFKHIYLGQFDTPEAAHEAYKAAALKHFGEFARSA